MFVLFCCVLFAFHGAFLGIKYVDLTGECCSGFRYLSVMGSLWLYWSWMVEGSSGMVGVQC